MNPFFARVVLTLLCCGAAADAQSLLPTQTLVNPQEGPSDGSAFDHAGAALSAMSDTLLVGSADDRVNEGSGSVRVYRRNAGIWEFQQRLRPVDADAQGFGHSVDLYTSFAVIGAYASDGALPPTQHRVAYVFERIGNTWTQRARLEVPTTAGDGRFGSRVAISAGVVAIAAPGASGDTQRVFIYRRSGDDWPLAETIERTGDASFGEAIDLYGNTVLIGAPASNATQGQKGEAFAYEFLDGSWQQHTRFAPMRRGTVTSVEGFGSAVSITVGRLVIGASGSEVGGRGEQGAAFVYTLNPQQVWTEASAPLLDDGGRAGDRFGAAVATASGRIVVGMPGRASAAGVVDNGGAQVFRLSNNVWQASVALMPDIATHAVESGAAVAFITDTAIVGAPGHPLGALSQAGAVQTFGYVANGDRWQAEPLLQPADGANQDRFGGAIAVDTGTLLVGAPGGDVDDHSGQGVVHDYVRVVDGWTWRATLRVPAPDGFAGDAFGASVDVVGDLAVIGAPRAWTALAPDTGRAYVFRRVGGQWQLESALGRSDEQGGDRFGTAVRFDRQQPGRLVVGAPGEGATDAGAAHLYERIGGQWTHRQRVVASDALAGDNFGASLALSGDHLAIGAPGRDGFGADQGAAYVFARVGNDFVQRRRLELGTTGRADDAFGSALAISLDGVDLYIGAPGTDLPTLADTGAVEHATRQGDQWTLGTRLPRTDMRTRDRFGSALSQAGAHLLVGAPARDLTPDLGAGVAFLYDLRTALPPMLLRARIPDYYAAFGAAVALVDTEATLPTTMLVGAPGHFGPSPDFNWLSGNVEVFDGDRIFSEGFE